MAKGIHGRLLVLGLFGLCVIILSGCTGTNMVRQSKPALPQASQTSQAAGKAQQDVGFFEKLLHAAGIGNNKPAPDTGPHTLNLRIFTANNLNAGTGDEALGLVLKVYRLKSPESFEQASFKSFLDAEQARNVLGMSLISNRQMLLQPGKTYSSIQELPQSVRYLGFVALFRGPAAHRWRFVYDVRQSESAGISLGVHACALSSTSGQLVTQLSNKANSIAAVQCPSVGM